MAQELVVTTLGGPVTVGYYRRGGNWICTALDFDLVGIGLTQEKAFAELRDVVNTYLEETLKADKATNFFNPSEPKEWDSATKKEEYRVIAVMAKARSQRRAPRVVRNIRKLRPFRNRIRAFDLAAVGA